MKNMGLFESLEKSLAAGAVAFGEVLQNAGEQTSGWGRKTDEFIADDSKWEKLKTATEDMAAKVDEFLTDLTNKKDKPCEDCGKGCCGDLKAEEPTQPEHSENIVDDEEDEEFVVATTQEDGDIVAPVAATASTDNQLSFLTLGELRTAASALGIAGTHSLNRPELLARIREAVN